MCAPASTAATVSAGSSSPSTSTIRQAVSGLSDAMRSAASAPSRCAWTSVAGRCGRRSASAGDREREIADPDGLRRTVARARVARPQRERRRVRPRLGQQLDGVEPDREDRVRGLEQRRLERSPGHDARPQRVTLVEHALGLVRREHRRAEPLGQRRESTGVERPRGLEAGEEDGVARGGEGGDDRAAASGARRGRGVAAAGEGGWRGEVARRGGGGAERSAAAPRSGGAAVSHPPCAACRGGPARTAPPASARARGRASRPPTTRSASPTT